MSLHKIRTLTVALPILSVCVSSGIVTHQYMRKDRLKREYRQATREIQALEARTGARAAPDHDEHDH